MASRLKERGGGGGKIMAAKPHKPHPESTPKEIISARKTPVAAAGKEKPRSVSSGRPSVASAGVRWSTSSMPRGKALDPSSHSSKENLSSLRAARPIARTSLSDGKSLDAFKISEKSLNGMKAAEIRKMSVRNGCKVEAKSVNLVKKPAGNANSKDFKASKENMDTCHHKSGAVPSLKPVDVKSLDPLVGGDVHRLTKDKVGDSSASNSRTSDVICVMEKGGDSAQVVVNSQREVKEKTLESIRVFESLHEKKIGEEGNGAKGISNCSSKLREKLTLLEGRVQKIASDIKRTKEMLEQNNTNESKLILSDIQSKISGLEKAVGQVIDGTKYDLGSLLNTKDDSLLKKHVVDSKTAVKVLNHEELEARFFPHHRLLRGRTSLGGSEDQGHCLKPNLSKQCGEVEQGSLSPIDENSIAIEFLASLDADLPEAKKKGRTLQSSIAALHEAGMETNASSAVNGVSWQVDGLQSNDNVLMANEKLEEFDDQENKPTMMLHEETEESCPDQLFDIGRKASTGGWFVSEGEAVLLAHDDGSCSYYDIVNSEEKSAYKPPAGVSKNLWGDCWLIRAPGVDGCSGRYVLAASAGNSLDSGFCTWDFYSKDIVSYRIEDGSLNSSSTSSSRTALAPLTNMALSRRSFSCTMPAAEGLQWWYRPCGPLLISTASRQKVVSAYDIRDGDLVMKWEISSLVNRMEYSSPLQWRSRGKVVVAETEAIALWDVNSLNPQPLLSVASTGKNIHVLHVNNTDAELGGGVRQRVSSSDMEGNDGVFCTQDSINVLDFRLPSGVGNRISRKGPNALSIFSRGDSIFIGSTESRLSLKSCPHSSVQHYSLRKGRLMASYALPDSNSHFHHSSITQVWGNSNLVMGLSGMGLFVFDAFKDDPTQSLGIDQGSTVAVKESIGPDDLYCPTFDFLGSRVLVISRDRPAIWRYLL